MTRHRGVTANIYYRNPHPGRGVRALIHAAKHPRLGPRWAAPDFIAYQEGQHVPATPGYRLYRADTGIQGREIPIHLRITLTRGARFRFYPGARATASTGANSFDRGIVVLEYKKRGRPVTVINTHLPVGGNRAHTALVVGLANDALRAGRFVFVCADANTPPDKGLAAALRDMGFHVIANRVDVFAASPNVTPMGRILVPPQTFGSDKHDAIVFRGETR